MYNGNAIMMVHIRAEIKSDTFLISLYYLIYSTLYFHFHQFPIENNEIYISRIIVFNEEILNSVKIFHVDNNEDANLVLNLF